MDEIHRQVQGFAEPRTADKSSAPPQRPHTLRDRWESVRYGPVGRILGYCLAFTLIFLLIIAFLWALEHYHF